MDDTIAYVVLLIIAVVFIIYIVLMNLFLIISILSDSSIRGRLFFKLILLIAVAHFLQGSLVVTLHLEILISRGMWTHDPEICTFWYLTDLTLTTVEILLFLMLMFERFFSLTYPQIVTNNCLGLLMLLAPWILSTGFVLFLYYALPRDFFGIVIDVIQGKERRDTCTLTPYVQSIYSILGYFCPAVYVFGFSWANVVILCLQRRRYSEGPSHENPRSHTTAASMVAMCFIAMWFPANSRYITQPEIIFINTTFSLIIGFANGALTPTLWLIIPEIKRRFHLLCCCCCIACCSTPRPHGTVVSSAVDDDQVSMLGEERVQPSATTKL